MSLERSEVCHYLAYILDRVYYVQNRCNQEFGIEWKNPAYRGGTNKSVLFHSIENDIPYH